MAERYYVIHAYGAGWDVYSWSRSLDRARDKAGMGWVVRAGDQWTALRLLYYHVKNHPHDGNDRTIWRGSGSLKL